MKEISQSVYRVGILLDSLSIPLWVQELIDFIESDQRFEICFYAINNSEKSESRSSLLYRFLRKVDQRLMALPGNPFRRVELKTGSTPLLKVVPIQKKFSDYFPDSVLETISNDFAPDFLLRFGFRILRGKILQVAKHGVLSLHHGDTASYRGGPPAFWEVVNKESTTGVTLQLLTEQLDAGVILGKTILRTDTSSFYRNQQKLYWAGLRLFQEELRLIADNGWESYVGERKKEYVNEVKGKLYRNPGNYQSLRIVLLYLSRLFWRRIVTFLFKDQWVISYRLGSGHQLPFDFGQSRQLLPPDDRIWADPFLYKKDSIIYLFFEEKRFSEKKAHISLLRFSSEGLLLAEKPETVLSEPFHLSYPFVFSWENEVYLIPESAEANQVILYQSARFPHEWKRERVLLEGVKAYDSTLYYHTDGNWYLFCTVKSDGRYSSDAYLHIYYSPDFRSVPFISHPMNPVYKDARKSRMAGAIFKDPESGHLIRPAQNSSPHYGASIRFYKITELSADHFHEELHLEQTPPQWGRSTHSFHQLENWQVTDVQRRNFFL